MSLIKPAEHFGKDFGQVVSFSLTGRLPGVTSTVQVAEAFRDSVLSALHAITGSKNSFLISGHNPDGSPDMHHRHVYFLPQPTSEGLLGRILVVSPVDHFSEDELTALTTVKRIQWNGPSTRLQVELIDKNDCHEQQLATQWESATPYVPFRRFWGTSGKHHLTPDRQLAKETSDIIETVHIQVASVEPWVSLRVRIVVNKHLSGDLQRRIRKGFRVRLQTDHPIVGPIALGHSSHFGLGQFRPVRSESVAKG